MLQSFRIYLIKRRYSVIKSFTYNSNFISWENRKNILKDAKDLKYDCYISSQEGDYLSYQLVTVSLSDILEKFSSSCFFGITVKKDTKNSRNSYIEIYFNVFSVPVYSVILCIKLRYLSYFIKKYKLVRQK